MEVVWSKTYSLNNWTTKTLMYLYRRHIIVVIRLTRTDSYDNERESNLQIICYYVYNDYTCSMP